MANFPGFFLAYNPANVKLLQPDFPSDGVLRSIYNP